MTRGIEGSDHAGRGTVGVGRGADKVSIREAAALLGCHPNTVRNRVKAGMYRGEKVHTNNGLTWMIERDSLTTNAPTSAPQQGISGVPVVQQEALQELARAIVKEAGIQQDPEQEAAEKRRQEFIEGGREHWKAQVDFFKHMAVVSGASIIAVTATVGTFKGASDIGGYTSWLIPLSAICFLGAAVYSLISLFRASSRLVRFSWGTVPAREEAERSLTSSYSWPRRITYFIFSLGLIFLVFYVYSGEVLSRIERMI